jgi:hypothetical protein
MSGCHTLLQFLRARAILSTIVFFFYLRQVNYERHFIASGFTGSSFG